jgi:arylsulfatase
MTYFNQYPETVEEMLEHYDDWGSPSTYPHFSAGWAVALDAPFQYTKQVASDFGGTRNGMVFHWPKGIKSKGEIRTQFSHVNDIAPTIYEITGVPAPKMVNGITQRPIEGTSLVYSFNEAEAPEQHITQYFEMFGNRGVYHEGWLARTIHRAPWEFQPKTSLEANTWELYDTRNDFSLSTNLASENPEKLNQLQDLFMQEALKYSVLPIDDRLLIRTNAKAVGRPVLLGDRTTVTYHDGMHGLGVDIFIDLRNTSYTIEADVEIDNEGNGVMICQGGRFGGLSLYLKDGKPAFSYNFLGLETTDIIANKALSAGKYNIVYDFKYDGNGLGKGGVGTIKVNNQTVAEGRIEKTQPGLFSVDDLADVGIDEGTPVANYGKSSDFNGNLNSVRVEVKNN